MIMADKNSLIADFKALGIKPGMNLLTHSSLRRIGPVDGGADTVIDALLEVLGKRTKRLSSRLAINAAVLANDRLVQNVGGCSIFLCQSDSIQTAYGQVSLCVDIKMGIENHSVKSFLLCVDDGRQNGNVLA